MTNRPYFGLFITLTSGETLRLFCSSEARRTALAHHLLHTLPADEIVQCDEEQGMLAVDDDRPDLVDDEADECQCPSCAAARRTFH